MRLPLAQAVHAAVREVAHRHRDPERVEQVAGVLKAFALGTALEDRKPRAGQRRWQPPIDVEAARGRADSGDLELDLIELFTDVASLAGDLGVGIALLVDEMQDIGSEELGALLAPCTRSASRALLSRLIGHRVAAYFPVALAASKSVRRATVPLRLPSTGFPREMAERAWSALRRRARTPTTCRTPRRSRSSTG